MVGRQSPADETTPEPVDKTKAELLAAAVEVFAERGYDGAGVAEIARRAGLTTGAIYSRYTGKAQLLLDAIEHYAPNEIHELISGPARTDAPAEFLAHLGTRLVDGNRISSGLLIEVFAASRREPEVADSLRSLFDQDDARLTELITAGQVAGIFADDLPVDAVVRFCTALGLGMHMAASLGMSMPDGEDWAVVLERVIAAAAPTDPSDPDPPARKGT
ncbi:MAG: TetR/AcrR family transcriptional regulator [Acidimicrobiia bacterium]|nr:TetR/AcrR family transcriptional regulator [Acidimicrobiia bacterium]